MKVYIVTREPFPNGMAATNRIICYAKSLLSVGTNCEIIIFRRTEKYGSNPRNTTGIGTYEKIPFRYIGGTPLRGSNVIVRRYNDLADETRTIKYLRKNMKQGDVIFCFLGENPFAVKLQKFAHLYCYRIFREFCEYPYVSEKLNEKNKRKGEKYLDSTFKGFDGTICISQSLMDLANRYHPRGVHVKVPILVDFEVRNIEDKSAESDFPFIFHAGTLTEQKDGILGVLEAYGKACKSFDKPLYFILTGKKENSPHAEQIEHLLKEYEIEDRVRFLGRIPFSELIKCLASASMVIVNKYPNDQNKYCFSTKLGEYMAAGKPVIISQYGEAMNWLTDGVNALIVPICDTDALAAAIVKLHTDCNLRQTIGDNARKTCKENFDYHNWGKIISDAFSDGTNP